MQNPTIFQQAQKFIVISSSNIFSTPRVKDTRNLKNNYLKFFKILYFFQSLMFVEQHYLFLMCVL